MLDFKSNGVKIVGLHGMGGIGKTTLAKAVFNKILPHFEFRSFISNVRDLISRQEDGLISLQNKLMADLSITNLNNLESTDANASKIRKFVNEKNVLLVLDDVDEVSQLHALGATISKWQSDGRSRIIVTTRNRGVLGDQHYVNYLYEVKELYFEQALELFSYHALRRPKPTEEFMKLSKQIVTLTGNLPLAVEVFGSFLCDKRKVSEWEDALKKLEGIRPRELQDVLKLSFDGLDIENQRIFLDIACLFVNMRMKREDMIDILKGCDFKAEIALRVLEEKSLIKFTGDDTLFMHDQLRDMGRQIVQNENFADPGMRSRLWDRDKIISVLKNHKVPP
ncbi:Disease resistance protein [Corchorus olitorius]|uniref:Disease resistance protein n=1 Tax=Corchorus olitorius TaxID=93759 RepID=A0A1R3L0D1_9ROSI|nr:Disease resistance protein [Corchorus olitorius]